ncbi:hypothetical protein FACS1894178_6200 [Bacteroidia bacterium]|nr:hypothetical protein FACS1894178_6200 [Bacteroidia bacterium]
MRERFIYIFIIIIYMMTSCVSTNLSILYDSDDISQAIYQKQSATVGTKDIFLRSLTNTLFFPSRWYENFDLNRNSDTVFILEYVSIEGNYFFTVWNKTDTISFDGGKYRLPNGEQVDNITSHKETFFSNYMMKLVSEWNLVEIEYESKTNRMENPDDDVYATRICFYNNKYVVDSIRFHYFFLFERDQKPNYD